MLKEETIKRICSLKFHIFSDLDYRWCERTISQGWDQPYI